MTHYDAADYAGLTSTRRYEVVQAREGYEILRDAETGDKAIRCRRCTLVSHDPADIKQRYCAFCHVFHEDSL